MLRVWVGRLGPPFGETLVIIRLARVRRNSLLLERVDWVVGNMVAVGSTLPWLGSV